VVCALWFVALVDGVAGVVVQDVALGSCTLGFMHTRGHANHHVCVVDRDHGGVFTGDSFGISVPNNALRNEFDGKLHDSEPRFMFAATAPADFDAIEAIKSARRVRDACLRAHTRVRVARVCALLVCFCGCV